MEGVQLISDIFMTRGRRGVSRFQNWSKINWPLGPLSESISCSVCVSVCCNVCVSVCLCICLCVPPPTPWGIFKAFNLSLGMGQQLNAL